MKLFMVTVESGALSKLYQVKADKQQLAEHKACRAFYDQYPNSEITHYWTVKADKA